MGGPEGGGTKACAGAGDDASICEGLVPAVVSGTALAFANTEPEPPVFGPPPTPFEKTAAAPADSPTEFPGSMEEISVVDRKDPRVGLSVAATAGLEAGVGGFHADAPTMRTSDCFCSRVAVQR